MFGQTWSHDIMRKYVIIFGTLFNNIHITRAPYRDWEKNII